MLAVNMPNDETVSQRWRTYLTTVDDIEEKTGYDFLSKLPKKVQKVIESTKDNSSETNSANTNMDETVTPTPSLDEEPANKSGNGTKAENGKTNSGDRIYQSGSRDGCYYLTESGKKSYVDKKFCENAASDSNSTDNPKKETKPDLAEPSKSADEKPLVKSNDSGRRTYIRGSRGGCYYLNESGKKVYVLDKTLCQ